MFDGARVCIIIAAVNWSGLGSRGHHEKYVIEAKRRHDGANRSCLIDASIEEVFCASLLCKSLSDLEANTTIITAIEANAARHKRSSHKPSIVNLDGGGRYPKEGHPCKAGG